MKFNEILKIYGQNEQQLIERRLFKLGNKLFSEKWSIEPIFDSVTDISLSGKHKSTKIANIALIDGCKPYKYNIAGYAYSVKDMFHEYRHVQQYAKEWNIIQKPDITCNSDSKRMTDIVRRKFISFYYPSAYTNNYINDPSEIDAEIYAIEKSLVYFKSDSVIKEEEAKEILFQFMVSDEYYSRKILEKHNPKSTEDVLKIFKKHQDKTADILYPITMNIPLEFKDCVNEKIDMTGAFLTAPRYEPYRKAFGLCKTGIEQDKILEQTIVMEHPDVIGQVKRIEQELYACRAQVQMKKTEAYLNHSRDNAILPHEVNYAKSAKQLTDMNDVSRFTEGVVSIPVDDVIVLQ